MVAKANLVCKFPLLIQPVTYQSEVACLFSGLSFALQIWGLVSDYTWEAPEEIINQHMDAVDFILKMYFTPSIWNLE